MSSKDYVGYSLFDKVIIVAKKIVDHYDREDGSPVFTDRLQGYVVDPENKSMLKNALEWGKFTYEVCKDGKPECLVFEPQIFEFENRGWSMEILRVADNANFGGKLSFWTCNVSKDGKCFEVGINADLLLDIIKSQTFVNGSCDKDFMFARCKGRVGLLCEDMPEYKQAFADMRKKQEVKSKKTSKHVLGHAYVSLNEANAYVADLWVHYEAAYESFLAEDGLGEMREVRRFVGYKKLEKPIKFKWFPELKDYTRGDTVKLSELSFGRYSSGIDLHYAMIDKLPARLDAGSTIDYDISLEEAIIRYYWKGLIENYGRLWPRAQFCRWFGVSASETECPIPSEAIDVLKKYVLSIYD